MPLLSVITAGYAPKGGYLAETAASLLNQELPAGWEFEWVFQEDGWSPSLAELADRVPQVRYQANHEALGIAGTRNIALSRARGDLVRVLDHDDVLLPGGLGRPLPFFATSLAPWWVLAKADEIDFDGVCRQCPPPRWTGAVPPGRLGAVTDSGGRWSVYSAGMTARTDIVRALGGWLGVPRSEDVGLVTALAEISAGYVDTEVSWLYRRHPGQTHLGEDWQAREMQAVRLVSQRLDAIRSARVALAPGPAAAADTSAAM